jgi:hypothetical protein
MIAWFAIIVVGLWTSSLAAQGTYQEPESFVSRSFGGKPPAPKTLWVNDEIQSTARSILGHDLQKLRLVYWVKDGRSVWILDEIGKERPITTGLAVNQGKLEDVAVLVFRESRGWEVRHDFFTDQFKGLGLEVGSELNGTIDNISGATLSVRALTKLARLALVLHQRHAVP